MAMLTRSQFYTTLQSMRTLRPISLSIATLLVVALQLGAQSQQEPRLAVTGTFRPAGFKW